MGMHFAVVVRKEREFQERSVMRILKLILLSIICLAILNCGPVKFTEVKIAGTVSIPSASANVDDLGKIDEPAQGSGIPEVPCGQDTLSIPIKVLFVVDQSGSNAKAYKGLRNGTCGGRAGCVPATDPKKTFRSGSISDFFNRYKTKQNFSWGFESFQKKVAQSLIWENKVNVAFGKAQAMQAAIIKFQKDRDGGATPYLAALTRETQN
jgi:hypothetical protein